VRDALPAAAAGLLVCAFGVFQARAANVCPDLFIYRLGSQLGLRAQNPYDVGAVRAAVVEQFPELNTGPAPLGENCGYFLPPGRSSLSPRSPSCRGRTPSSCGRSQTASPRSPSGGSLHSFAPRVSRAGRSWYDSSFRSCWC